ncbi:MAG TPA: peptidase S41 [Prolixibacteraceae bacterium]|jgi:carboxyl-terminal processing protease|nr:peptidase S41 [Prolixibacteraceae bacterium]
MKNTKFSVYIPFLLALAVVVGMLIGNRLSRNSGAHQTVSSQSGSNKLDAIVELIHSSYVDSISTDTLVERAIPKLLKSLDPHTAYIPAKELGGVEEEMRGNFGGIGVQFSIQNDTVMVVDVISGGPSSKVGILPGDRIVTVNDTLLAGKGLKNEKVLAKLRGEKGTKVNVGVKRKGYKDLFGFDIVRGDIPIYSVDVSYMINPTTGFIKVSRFGEHTYEEFMDGMKKLDQQGMKNVIVDLRGNPGGYLNAVIKMVNEFLDKGELIVYTQGNSQPRKTFNADSKGTYRDKGIEVLIDDFSASASEIFAGAIQDNDRGWILGRRSFGKGLVQEQIPFNDGSALRLTVARYYTPSGRCIQKPYDKGTDAYYKDFMDRAVHGQFQKVDSTLSKDTTKYSTLAGRIVRGGGGIMPDYFIPADTLGFSPYYSKVTQKGLVYQFALDYADSNRKILSKLSNSSDFEKYFQHEDILPQFVAFAAKKGVAANNGDLKVSSALIDNQVKAYIARNIIGEEGFYPIIKNIDKVLQEAVEKSKTPMQQILTQAVTK